MGAALVGLEIGDHRDHLVDVTQVVLVDESALDHVSEPAPRDAVSLVLQHDPVQLIAHVDDLLDSDHRLDVMTPLVGDPDRRAGITGLGVVAPQGLLPEVDDVVGRAVGVRHVVGRVGRPVCLDARHRAGHACRDVHPAGHRRHRLVLPVGVLDDERDHLVREVLHPRRVGVAPLQIRTRSAGAHGVAALSDLADRRSSIGDRPAPRTSDLGRR